MMQTMEEAGFRRARIGTFVSLRDRLEKSFRNSTVIFDIAWMASFLRMMYWDR